MLALSQIERGWKVLVFCTDLEHGERIDPQVVALARGADLLVHEAQYTTEELQSKKGWGYSSYAQALQIRRLLL
jgi:ribonuclease BN (tRNA processing enzyme)